MPHASLRDEAACLSSSVGTALWGDTGAHRSFLPAFARRSFLCAYHACGVSPHGRHGPAGSRYQGWALREGDTFAHCDIRLEEQEEKPDDTRKKRSRRGRATFATKIWPGSAYARFATKIAMVKPTPPSNAAPKMCAQFTLLGSEEILSFTIKKLKRKIPDGLAQDKASKNA